MFLKLLMLLFLLMFSFYFFARALDALIKCVLMEFSFEPHPMKMKKLATHVCACPPVQTFLFLFFIFGGNP